MFTLQPLSVSDRSSHSLQGSKPTQAPPKGMFGGNHRAYNPDFQPWDMDFCTYRPILNPQDFQSATFDVNSFIDIPFAATLGGELPKATYQRFTEEESMRRPFIAAENNPAQSGREISSFDNQSMVFLSNMKQLKNDPRFTNKTSWEIYDYMRKEGIKSMYEDYFARSANGMGYTTR